MTQTQKGKKGFQPIPEQKRKNRRCVFYVTENQYKRLEAFCFKNGKKTSELINERIKDIIGNA